jgi:hypothetical protein
MSVVYKNLYGSQPEDGFMEKKPKHVSVVTFYLSFNYIYIIKFVLVCKIIYILLQQLPQYLLYALPCGYKERNKKMAVERNNFS